MATTTTLGVKLDEATRDRLKEAARRIDRTPHWLIKQAIYTYLETLESGATLADLQGIAQRLAEGDNEAVEALADPVYQPFLEFAESILPQSVLRSAITAAYRRPEEELLPLLLEQARLPAAQAKATMA